MTKNIKNKNYFVKDLLGLLLAFGGNTWKRRNPLKQVPESPAFPKWCINIFSTSFH